MGEQKEFLYEPLKPMLSDAVLAHHGILGQKWGKKNGPPYPLDGEDHSKSEKDAGYKKSLGGGRNEELYGRKKKSAMSKIDKKKTQKEEIDNHRKKMVDHYKKIGDKEAAKIYEKASDRMIADELQHRKNVKKAVIIAGTVVGLSAAAYIIYKRKGIGNLAAAKNFMGANSGDVAGLVSKGLDIDTAGKLMNLKMSGDLVKDDDVVKVVKNGLLKDMDLTLSGAHFKRTDFRPDFNMSKVSNPLFVAMTEGDAKTYKSLLPNRYGPGGIRQQILIDAVDNIKIPSEKNTKKILKELKKTDPNFEKDIISAFKNMAQKNFEINLDDAAAAKKVVEEIPDWAWGAGLKVQKMSKGTNYPLVAALGGGNETLNKKVTEAFSKHGYNALLDIHDVKDQLSDLPLIMLDPTKLSVRDILKV